MDVEELQPGVVMVAAVDSGDADVNDSKVSVSVPKKRHKEQEALLSFFF